MTIRKKDIQQSASGQQFVRNGKVVTLIREHMSPARPWFPSHKAVYAGKEKRPLTLEEKAVEEHRRRFPEIINIQKLSFSDFYTDPDLTRRLPKWNPTLYQEPLFHRDRDGRLGMTLIFLDDNTGTDREEMMIWRDSLGEHMEILYALTIINGKIMDKRFHEYKFATGDGIQNIFSRYMELLRAAGDDSYLNIVKQRLAFTAGVIKSVCCESVWRCDDMLSVVDEITDECMRGVVSELIGVPGRHHKNDNPDNSPSDNPKETPQL